MTRSTWSRRELFHRTGYGLAGVALAGTSSGLVSGCERVGEGGTLADAQDAGSIRVGVAGERPYGYTEGGEVTGEAPELARVILAELGIDTLEAQQVSFDALINGLNNESFDIICAGMAILPDRCEEIIFSEPDYCAQTALMVRVGGPAEGVVGFEGVAQNPDIRLATMGQQVVEYEWALANGVQESQITTVSTKADGYDALMADRIDAFTLTRASLQAQLDSSPTEELTLAEPFFPVVDGEEQSSCGGFGFRPADTELRDAFNEQLQALRDEGRLFEIVSEFGLTREEVNAAADKTTDQLCGDADDQDGQG